MFYNNKLQLSEYFRQSDILFQLLSFISRIHVCHNKHDKPSRSPGLSFKLWVQERLKVHCFGLDKAEQQIELGAHMANCLYSTVL